MLQVAAATRAEGGVPLLGAAVNPFLAQPLWEEQLPTPADSRCALSCFLARFFSAMCQTRDLMSSCWGFIFCANFALLVFSMQQCLRWLSVCIAGHQLGQGSQHWRRRLQRLRPPRRRPAGS